MRRLYPYMKWIIGGIFYLFYPLLGEANVSTHWAPNELVLLDESEGDQRERGELLESLEGEIEVHVITDDPEEGQKTLSFIEVMDGWTF